MPAHGLKSARAEIVLQACTGLTPASGFEYRLPDAKAPPLQAKQIDSAYNEIAPQIFRPDWLVSGTAHQCVDYRQVLPLDQRHLSRIANARAGVVAGEPGFQPRLDRV